jgi:acyl carrier protein
MSRVEQIRDVLNTYASLRVEVATVGVDDSLYALGMTSHASVRVMLGLEDAFDVEIPDRFLVKTTFDSVRSIDEMLAEISAPV